MTEGSDSQFIERARDDTAAVIARFLEHYDYYNVMNKQLSVDFVDIGGVRLIPGYNCSKEDIQHTPQSLKLKLDKRTLGLYHAGQRDDFYANYYAPETSDLGEPPDDAEIVHRSEVQVRG